MKFPPRIYPFSWKSIDRHSFRSVSTALLALAAALLRDRRPGSGRQSSGELRYSRPHPMASTFRLAGRVFRLRPLDSTIGSKTSLPSRIRELTIGSSGTPFIMVSTTSRAYTRISVVPRARLIRPAGGSSRTALTHWGRIALPGLRFHSSVRAATSWPFTNRIISQPASESTTGSSIKSPTLAIYRLRFLLVIRISPPMR